MSVIPWGRFTFIGYTIAICIVSCVALLDSVIFFCTMNGLLPIFVRSWRKKILFYSTVMALLGACLLILGVLALTENRTEQDIMDFLMYMWKWKYDEKVREEVEQYWDKVHIEYSCCGVNSAYTYSDDSLPKSCCAIGVKNCTMENVHKVYCFDAVTEYYETVLLVSLTAAAFAMSVLCFLFILLANVSQRLFPLAMRIEDEE